MCGRFTVNYTYEQMLEYLNKEYSIFDFDYDLPRYNVSPGQQVLGVVFDGENYHAITFKWGLELRYNKNDKIGFKMINTRSETIEEKAILKDLFFNKRCIILSDGFYEWDKRTGTNRPYYITFKDKKMMAYAGIWNGSVKDGVSLYSCSIITTEANVKLSKIHDRSPVVLERHEALKWIGENNNLEYLKNLLHQFPSDAMDMIEVSKKVNKVSNDDPSLIVEHHEYTLF